MNKSIFKIARTELYNLFFSPIAWLPLIIFLFEMALAYTTVLDTFLTRQNMGGPYAQQLKFLTSSVFAGQMGVFNAASSQLYLYIPLLTMGLISREINGGTIKLLYSSPVGIRQIVLGKFVGVMGYNLLLLGILGVFSLTAPFIIPHADLGLVVSGLLGIFLLLCAYSAIGLFLSCLTSYQVVAAIGTLAVFALLSYIGTIWQDYDFFRDLTYYLSISGRTGSMIAGLVTTKDVLYFVLIVLMFLGFSVCKLQGEREPRSPWRKTARYAGIVALVLGIGCVSSLPGVVGYLDLTANRTNTLTPNAQKIIDQIDGAPLEVTTYVNLLDNNFWYGLPNQRNNDLRRWEPYRRFKPDIHVRYVYYYDSTGKDMFKYYPGYDLRKLAEKYAKSSKVGMSLFETPAEIHRQIDLRPERNRYVMRLEYKGRSTFLRVFNDMQWWPGETEVSAAVQRLLLARLPKIAFVNGEGERSIDKAGDKHYKVLTSELSFRYALINQGFDVEDVSPRDQDIPSDVATLVIADPQIPFDSAALGRISRYVAGGGNLLIAGEPGRGQILEPLLKPLGVGFKPGMLVQRSKDFAPNLVLPNLTDASRTYSKILTRAWKDSLHISMPGASALTFNPKSGFQVSTLLVTDSINSWNTLNPPSGDEQPVGGKNGGMMGTFQVMAVSNGGGSVGGGPEAQPPAFSDDLVFSAAGGDERGPFPTALSLTRSVNGHQQRIVVTGDGDFMSNAELARNNVRQANYLFGAGLFSWLTGGAFPIDTSRPDSPDNRLDLTDGGLAALSLCFKWILPALLVLAETMLLLRRRRQ